MARAAHTPEQIHEAADRLAADGQEPNPGNLREALGGKGSFTTITKHLEIWREKRRAQPGPVAIEMPESVKEAFAKCWQAVSVEAGKEVAAAREKANADIAAARALHAEALAVVAQVEAEQESETARADALAEQIEAERLAAQTAATGAAAREAGLTATATELRSQIEAQRVELQHAHETVRVREQERDAAQIAATEATAREAGLSATATELRSQLEALRAELQHAHDAVRLREQERDRATASLDQLRVEFEAVKTAERQQFEATARAEAEASRLADQLKDQKGRTVDVIARMEKAKQAVDAEVMELRREAKAATGKLGQAEGQIEALKAQVLSQAEVIKGFAPKTSGKGGN